MRLRVLESDIFRELLYNIIMVRADDKALVQLARQGKPDAFRILAGRYHRALHGILLAELGDPDRALSAARAAFTQAQEKLHTLRKPEQFWPWLLHIALRSKGSPSPTRSHSVQEDIAAASGSSSPAQPELAIKRQRILQLISKLPQPLREVLVLHFLEGADYEAMAGILNVPVTTIRSRMSRAKAVFLKYDREEATP